MLIAEARNLIVSGVRELILIAQDSTRYGVDLYGKSQLFELLEGIDALEGDFHYRVLYLYPDLLTKKHLERLTKLKKFIPYFDLPLQHASPKILKAMGRFYDHQMTLELLDFIEGHFPERFVRTNFIIGFPGETEEDFAAGMDFVRAMGFARMHVFPYSARRGTPAARRTDQVSPMVRKERAARMQALAEELAEAYHRSMLGSVAEVLFETCADGVSDGLTETYVRVYTDAPVTRGEIVPVRLTHLYRDGVWGALVE